MKKSHLMAGACWLLVAAGAEAHAHLKASNPKENAVVTRMPDSISLTFSESARITVVSIQKDAETRLSLTAPDAVGERLELKVPPLAPGAYVLRWRLVSTDDGHIMSGELHFKIAPAP